MSNENKTSAIQTATTTTDSKTCCSPNEAPLLPKIETPRVYAAFQNNKSPGQMILSTPHPNYAPAVGPQTYQQPQTYRQQFMPQQVVMMSPVPTKSVTSRAPPALHSMTPPVLPQTSVAPISQIGYMNPIHFNQQQPVQYLVASSQPPAQPQVMFIPDYRSYVSNNPLNVRNSGISTSIPESLTAAVSAPPTTPTPSGIKRQKLDDAANGKMPSSRFRGVYWNKSSRAWRARIWVDGRNEHIGNFDDEVEAAMAWDARSREIRGKGAPCNFETPPVHVPSQRTTSRRSTRQSCTRRSVGKKRPLEHSTDLS